MSSEPLTLVCHKWHKEGYRSKFKGEHVNTLFDMFARNYRKPFYMVCVTDDPEGIDPAIRIVPLNNDFANLPNPHNASSPSCYRRLKLFSPEAKYIFGPRILSLDLDCVIVGDLTDTLDTDAEFIGYVTQDNRKDGRPVHYNGSLTYLKAGTRTKVWEQFDPETSPKKAKAAGYMGSDQAWISYCLGPNEKTLGPKDGFLSYRIHGAEPITKNARFVSFYGNRDPWHPEMAKLKWVQENYR